MQLFASFKQTSETQVVDIIDRPPYECLIPPCPPPSQYDDRARGFVNDNDNDDNNNDNNNNDNTNITTNITTTNDSQGQSRREDASKGWKGCREAASGHQS